MMVHYLLKRRYSCGCNATMCEAGGTSTCSNNKELKVTDTISKTTCKRCLKLLAEAVGLLSDTPADIIHDKAIEDNLTLD